ANRLPRAAGPDHYRATSIFALGDYALELAVLERMVLCHNRETLLCRIQARALGHGPALAHAVMLTAEIEMGAARRMRPDTGAVARLFVPLRRRLRSLAEIALGAVGRKRVCGLRPRHDLGRFSLRCGARSFLGGRA